MTLSERNGVHAPPLPRRVGAVPHRTGRNHYQLERWEVPGVGERWYVSRGGAWLARREDIAGWTTDMDEACHAETAERAKRLVVWYESSPRLHVSLPYFSVVRPVPPASLLYRVGGLDWRLEERAAGGSWRVRLGDRLLTTGGDLVPAVPFATRADVEFSSAASAQAAVETYLTARSRPALAHRIRKRLEAFERLESDATVTPGPGGATIVTFIPRRGAAP